MTIRTSAWPVGVPCWTDLATSDVEKAQLFYAAVLGWQFLDPAEDFGGYVIAHVGGAATAGIGPLMGDQQRPSWTLYLASDNADETAIAVDRNGGTVLLAPGDVGPSGRMFIASDPAGAVFGVWQAGTAIGSSLVNEPGGITWEDLRSTDPDAARAFYGAVFGYDFQPVPMAGPDYTTFHSSDQEPPLGGMGGMFGAPEGTPSHWLVYFSVADLDAALGAAESSGGHVLAPAFETPYGRRGAVVDPAAATFWLMQQPPDQPRPDREG